MKRVFHDPSLEKEFATQGFVVVDLLSEGEVNHLVEFYHEHDLQPEQGGFYATMFHTESEKKKFINDSICAIVHR